MTVWEIIGVIVLLGGASLGIINSVLATKKPSSDEDNLGKYLCPPCGYIYDPKVGDPDSGIAPGTRFEDIPDSWRCPICGVAKSDFIPLYKAKEQTSFSGEIVKHVLINKTQDVLLLKVKVTEPLTIKPGQYFSFILQDKDGNFRRSYSIVKEKENVYTFLIRIQVGSRGGNVLTSKKVGDTLNIAGVFGDFTLSSSANKKVFIGTGTGLAPLFHMMRVSNQKDNILLFGSKSMDDIFYLEELAAIESVKNILVYLSRQEQMPENRGNIIFKKGHMNFDTFFQEFPEYAQKATEFYLCGNPNVVSDAQTYLNQKEYPNVFIEKF